MSGFRRADDPVYPPRKVMQDARTHALGLTIREHFAAMAMQGILSRSHLTSNSQAAVSALAVEHADALIAELAK